MAEPKLQPVHDIEGSPAEGAALCLSGGGYRAMLFHAGCFLRMNEAGLLGSLKRISSVSGGSIAAGVLGLHWTELGLSAANPSAPISRFFEVVVQPIRKLASTTIDEGAILGGIFLPGAVAGHLSSHYDSLLFHGKTLQDLPDDSAGPRFLINATNVQSGALMRFSKPYLRDYRVGQVLRPKLPLALAVAASSAFPPVLSPCEIDAAKYGLTFEPAGPGEDLHTALYITKMLFTDGGVYDNLALESAWKSFRTIFASDGSGHLLPEPSPHHDWARHAYRVIQISDNQVRALRTRQLIQLFQDNVRAGCYWGIRQDLSVYTATPALPCPAAHVAELAAISTRLAKLDDKTQERLINWGYAVSDASLRAYYDKQLPLPAGFPYPASAV